MIVNKIIKEIEFYKKYGVKESKEDNIDNINGETKINNVDITNFDDLLLMFGNGNKELLD